MDAAFTQGMDTTDWVETVRYIHTALWIANILIYGYAISLWVRPSATAGGERRKVSAPGFAGVTALGRPRSLSG